MFNSWNCMSVLKRSPRGIPKTEMSRDESRCTKSVLSSVMGFSPCCSMLLRSKSKGHFSDGPGMCLEQCSFYGSFCKDMPNGHLNVGHTGKQHA